MRLHVIGTGSTGNAYVLDAGEDQLLLECGMRWETIQQALGHDLSRLRAALISHEHKDHCKGLEGVARAGIPCVMTAGTRDAIGIDHHRIQVQANDKQFRIGNFVCLQFATEHDAADPCGWLIQYQPTGETLLFATDTYYLRVKPAGVHYWLLECNYIADTLDRHIASGLIPESVRYRLLRSHFALHNVVGYLGAVDLSKARQIVLLHMSAGNSDERRMVSEIEYATGLPTTAARADHEISLEICPF